MVVSKVRYYQRYLVDVVRKHFPEKKRIVGAEIGVWKGELSVYLLEQLPNLTLHMVDCWERIQPNRGTNFTEEHAVVARLEAEGRTDFARDRRQIHFATSEEASGVIKDNELDFVFIDAEHVYHGIYADIRFWFPKVRLGGLMSGHDYSRFKWDVKRAVDEYVEEHGFKLTTTRAGRVWWFPK